MIVKLGKVDEVEESMRLWWSELGYGFQSWPDWDGKLIFKYYREINRVLLENLF